MKNVGSMGQDTHPSHDLLFWGGGLIMFNTFYGCGVSRFPGNVEYFFLGNTLFAKCTFRGLGSQTAHHFLKMG